MISSLSIHNNNNNNANPKQQPLIPPIQPFSPQEISTFTALDLALRSHPELAREGASLGLNPRALAKLVHGMKMFQDAHLGRRSKYTATQSWPITKLPDTIFRSRSAKGPLYTLFLTCYKLKKEKNWKTFDFVSMNRYDDNIMLLKQVTIDLIKDRWLVRPVCYFDESVDESKIQEYSKIITKFGGIVVDEFNGMLDTSISDTLNEELTSPKKKKARKSTSTTTSPTTPKPIVTHVIAWDDEEHDSETTLQDEETSPFANNYEIVEKLYLRTVSVIDPSKQSRGNQSNIVETNMMETKKKGGKLGGKGKKGKSPNDANSNPLLDNNIPLAFVHWWYLPESYDEFMLASDVDGDPDIPPKPDGGPWVVGCKFIRDVMKFNEWGLEADYAITDYEKKVTLYKELAKKKLEEEVKLKHQEEELAKKSKVADRKKSNKSPIIRLKLTSGNKNTSTEVSQEPKVVVRGMNPRQIFTGYYGGENNRTKIRHLVYDGALVVPNEATSLIHDTIEQLTTKVFGESLLKAKYDLPQIGSVLRPSEDPYLLNPSVDGGSKGGLLITELQKTPSNTTKVATRRCIAKDFDIGKANLPQRIRGGGGEEEKEGILGESSTKTTGDDVIQEDKTTNRMDVDEKEVVTQEAPLDTTSTPMAQDTSPTMSSTGVESSSHNKDTLALEAPQTEVISKESINVQIDHKEESNINQENVNDTLIKQTSNETEKIVESTNSTTNNNIDSKSEEKSDNVASAQNSESKSDSKPDLVESAQNKTPNQEEKSDNPQAVENEESKTDENPTVASKSAPSISNASLVSPLQQGNALKEKKESPEPLTGDQEPTTKLPQWYNPNKVSTLEMTLLPEWFDNSANHRTKESYITARTRMIELASKSSQKYVTGTAARRHIPGDAGSLLRLHQFLVSWGFINGSAFGDSTPTEISRSTSANEKPNQRPMEWSVLMLNTLAESVASFATRKRKRQENGEENELCIDWDIVAEKVGRNVTPDDCYRKFLSTNFEDSKFATTVNQMDIDVETDDATAITVDNDVKEDKNDLITQIVDGVRPEVARAAIDSALHASNGNLSETQQASLLSAVASQAAERAREEESAVNRVLQEILDQRMSKLENRLSLLDDLECMFDAERMALELERRDLYTLRCRHWFAGDS